MDVCGPFRIAVMVANPVNELMGKHQGHPGWRKDVPELVPLKRDEMAIDSPWKFRIW